MILCFQVVIAVMLLLDTFAERQNKNIALLRSSGAACFCTAPTVVPPVHGGTKTHLFRGQQAKDRTQFVSPTCVNLTVCSLPFVGDGRWPKRTLSFADCPHNKFSFSSGECCRATLRPHPPAAVHLWPLSRAELRSLLLLRLILCVCFPFAILREREKKKDSFVI